MVNNLKKQHVEDPEEMIESAIDRSEHFLERNGKKLLIALGVIVIVVTAFFSTKYLVLAPREQKASAMMYVAQIQFAQDSFAMALNGTADFDGFLAVIDEYGSTATGNIAKHYAGVCYMQMGEYQSAIDFLSSYSKVKGEASGIINAQNSGLIGDANVQLGNLEQAAKMYEKAIALSENDLTAPYYLKKAGVLYEKLGDNKKALASYEKIKNNYFRSFEARDIDKYIGKVQQ